METNCAHNCLAVNMKVIPGLFIQIFIDKQAPEIGHKNLWNADPDVNEVIHGSIPAQLFLHVYDHAVLYWCTTGTVSEPFDPTSYTVISPHTLQCL